MRSSHGAFTILGACLLMLRGAEAFALQPLEAFVQAARRTNPQNREARATVAQRQAEADVATGRLLPAGTATGLYSRNQYEVKLVLPASLGGNGESLTIQPLNQLDGTVTVSIPIIDVAGWARRSAAKATAAAAEANRQATALDVERRVVQAYVQLVGEQAVLGSVKKSAELSRQNAEVVRSKKAGGVASELDVQRAEGDVQRSEGDVASADLAVITAARSLASLTGIEPDNAPANVREVSLEPEAPLETWLKAAGHVPSVLAAHGATEVNEEGVRAARLGWLPTLGASGQQRFTNATSFVGHSSYYILQATLTWRLDFTLHPSYRAQAAATEAAAAREEGVRREAADAIIEAWHQVRVNIDKTRAAQAQAKATTLAAQLARERYDAGMATQIDVLQAQRDALVADVSRIQALAQLSYARAALRLEAGQSYGGESP